MKWILIAFSLFYANDSWAFGPEYACQGANGSQLQVKVHITRAGERISAFLQEAGQETVTFSGFQDFGSKGYALTDSLGNPAELTLAYQPVRPRPCGRGGCEPVLAPALNAHLSYLGAHMQFTCHEAP